MIFRYAGKEDADRIMSLYKSAAGTYGCTWDDNYPNFSICMQDIESNSLLCLTDEDEIVAAISYDMDEIVDKLDVWNPKYGKTRELARLVVKEEHRNRGIARLMILKAMDELKKRGYKAVHYLVSPTNLCAIKSYEKLGFNMAGECEYAGKNWYAYEKQLYFIENSITVEYKNRIWNTFIKGIEKYGLIESGDHIAVCISGGKDSMLLAKLLKMYSDYKMKDISLEFLMMNPGYDENNLRTIEYNAAALGITINIFETSVFDDTDEIGKNPCFFCSRMRRGYLYRKAKELGCNKIALGHHYDDVVETILMGMLYGSQIQTMLPKLDSDNVEGMKLIRPMYLIKEEDITLWQKSNNLEFVKCACKIAQKDGFEDTTRLKIKKLIQDLTNENPHVKDNIFGSVQNVDLNKIMSYKLNGKIYSPSD